MVKFFKTNNMFFCLYRMDAFEVADKELRISRIEKLIQDKNGNSLKIYYPSSGKPLIQGQGAISISHKNDLLFFVWTEDAGYHLGCDLETVESKVNWNLFEKHYFSPIELSMIEGRFRSKEEACLSLFSSKEAVFKAVGKDHEVLFGEQSRRELSAWKVDTDDRVRAYSCVLRSLILSLCIKKNA